MGPRFPLLKVRGTPYEIGIQVGEALRDKIPLAIDQIFDHELTYFQGLTPGIDPPTIPEYTRQDVLTKALEFLPLFESYSPGMVDELRGIAKGAGLGFEEALLLQIRGEVIYAIAGGCTSFALSGDATGSGRVIIGQNWDYAIDGQLLTMLHITPDEGPRQLMMTFVGLTSYLGINSAGIGNFANALPWVWCEIGIPHYPLWWRIFRETSLGGIRTLLDETKSVQAENLVLCDGSGEIADVELTPEGAAWLDNTEGFFVHTNHFLAEPYASRPELPPIVPDSVARHRRLHSLVEQHYGQIEASTMQRFLADHQGFPTSICRHDAPQSFTSASMVAEPERGVMHVCAGNPCSGEFVTYTV